MSALQETSPASGAGTGAGFPEDWPCSTRCLPTPRVTSVVGKGGVSCYTSGYCEKWYEISGFDLSSQMNLYPPIFTISQTLVGHFLSSSGGEGVKSSSEMRSRRS